jgi:hypothetical protein
MFAADVDPDTAAVMAATQRAGSESWRCLL